MSPESKTQTPLSHKLKGQPGEISSGLQTLFCSSKNKYMASHKVHRFYQMCQNFTVKRRSMVNSFEERTPGEIQTMSLCNDKNPISLDLHFIPLTKQPNDLFTFYTFTAGTSISFFFPQLVLSLFLVSFSSIFQF